MADEQINEGLQRTLTATFTKRDGSPGAVEAQPLWEFATPAIATTVVSADGMSVKVQHNGGSGDFDYNMTADGDLGAGVFPIVRTGRLMMMPPLGASGGDIGVGAEEPIA